jgi:hypothetical protein
LDFRHAPYPLLKKQRLHGMLTLNMRRKILGFRKMLVILTLLVATGLVKGTLEAKDSTQPCQAHHCVTCHVSQHAATTPSPVRTQMVVPHESRCVVESATLESLSFARQLDPPPKFLA